jgi:hypothetical protein
MLRHRRYWLVVAIALLAFAGAFLPRTSGRAAEPPLSIDSATIYSLRADRDDLEISFNATVTRNDTGAAVYDRLRIPLLAGAWNTSAAMDNGNLLSVEVEGASDKAYGWATVVFGSLAPGQTIKFHLNYTLINVQYGYSFISPAYISLPVVTIGDPAKVTIELPPIESWYSTVQPGDCETTEGAETFEFSCSGSQDVYTVALIEVANASQYSESKFSVPLAGGSQAIDIRYLTGDPGWADRVRRIATDGLPRLETFIGASLPSQGELVILQVGRTDIYGYDGIFQCLTTANCRIGVAALADDQVVLHELAHRWTTNYDNRWLAEGMAEFASRNVATDLGVSATPWPDDIPTFLDSYLDDWGSLSLLTTEDEYNRELASYRDSYRFFEDIKNTIGLDSLQKADAGAAKLPSLDSRNYFDLLEAASGKDLGALFVGRVFPPDFSKTLDQRNKANFELAILQGTIADSKLELHTDAIEASIKDWDLFGALDKIADATIAIQAYQEGRQARSNVSLWEKLGLIGKDPQGRLDDAEVAFNKGDFAHASQLARSANAMYSNAGQSSRNRLLVGLVVIVFVPVLIFGGLWAWRGQQQDPGRIL